MSEVVLFLKTSKERVAILHQKMRRLQRKREKRALYAAGGICSLLTVFLITLIRSLSFPAAGTSEILYTGSSLLDDGAGGYVLTALIAFMAGVVITVIIKKRLGKEKNDRENKS